jgi:hypothetical protein
VNEVVIPAGLKDAFNSLPPEKDATIPAVVKRVTEPELPKLIEAIYGIPAPATPRTDLVELFLTGITTKAGGPIKADLNSQLDNADVEADRFQPSEQLRLNLSVPVTASPDRLGVLAGDLQGFPNGRRLTDDVLDIGLQALEGAAASGQLVAAIAAGDKVDANDNAFGATFPFVALPNSGAVNKGGGTAAGAMSGGPAPESSLSPAASSTGDWPSTAVAGTAAAIIAAVAALATLFLIGWRRRGRPVRVVGPDDTARL